MLRGLNHLTIAVSDLDSALAFYVDFLGMEAHVRWNDGAYISLSNVWFCLSCGEVSPSQDYSHIALDIGEESFESFTEKVRMANIPEWKQNESEGNSIYILDPDGNKLEVHSGGLQSRLSSLKNKPYPGLIWL